MIHTSGGVKYIRNWRFTRSIVGMVFILRGNYKSATPKNNRVWSTNKRTDLWSRDFIVWKINFWLWVVGLGWTV